jgi:hypothetical protein
MRIRLVTLAWLALVASACGGGQSEPESDRPAALTETVRQPLDRAEDAAALPEARKRDLDAAIDAGTDDETP